MPQKKYYDRLSPEYRLNVELDIEKHELLGFRVSLECGGPDDWHAVGGIQKFSVRTKKDIGTELENAIIRLTEAYEGHEKKRRHN